MKSTKLIVLKNCGGGYDYDGVEERLNSIDGVAAVTIPEGINFEVIEIDQEPLRRVFHVDCGDMPPHKQAEYLDIVKKKVQEAKLPSPRKSEDMFFAVTSGSGKYSKVEYHD